MGQAAGDIEGPNGPDSAPLNPALNPALKDLEAAYSRWSPGSLIGVNYRFEVDVVLIAAVVVASLADSGASYDLSNYLMAIPVSLILLSAWRIVRLLFWIIAGRPWRPGDAPTLTYLSFVALYVWQTATSADQSERFFSGAWLGALLTDVVMVAAAVGVAVTIFGCLWIRSSRSATEDGKKFIVFGFVISLILLWSFLGYQRTLPDPIMDGSFNQKGGMALFVANGETEAYMQVVPAPNGVEEGVFVEDTMSVDLQFRPGADDGNETEWALQLSGGWLVDDVKGEADLIENKSLIPIDDTSHDERYAAQTFAVLPHGGGAAIRKPIDWISPGPVQVISGTGDTRITLDLKSHVIVNSGGTISAAWPPVGCAPGLTRALAQTYANGRLPKDVLTLNGDHLSVPTSCDVVLGSISSSKDLFPEFASSPLTLSGAIGWRDHDESPTFEEAQSGALEDNRDVLFSNSSDFSELLDERIGDLTIGSRKLRLSSANSTALGAGQQALYVGVFGTALGASAILLDLLVTRRWGGLFSPVSPPAPPQRSALAGVRESQSGRHPAWGRARRGGVWTLFALALLIPVVRWRRR